MVIDLNDKKSLIEFYKKAKQICIDSGYGHEIQYVEERHFKDIDVDTFFGEYAFVVLSSGISNKAAESMYEKFMKTQKMSSVKHPGKRKALEKAGREHFQWFDLLTKCKDDGSRIQFIQTLPYMGPATSYHLARNLGIDCAKPDRHLKRIAEHFGYDVEKIKDLKRRTQFDIIGGFSPKKSLQSYGFNPSDEIQFVQWMCEDISKKTKDRIGTVDVILWRACTIMQPWNQKEGKVVGW